MSYRTDEDSLGPVRVPSRAYYGPFTARAAAQYRAAGQPSHPGLVRAFAMVKRAAAAANMRAGALDRRRGRAIVRACDRVISGELAGQFPVDALNSGAGTAVNMNANEVIANAALELLGRPRGDYSHLHPNDHVNMSQSSNDTYPTAMHVAVLEGLRGMLPAVRGLERSLSRAARRFGSHRKVGRTHLMDALPVTLGDEFAAYAVSVGKARAGVEASRAQLRLVALGGTAVGSGANAPRGYRRAAVAELARVSGLPLRPEPNMHHGLQSRYAVAAASAALRGLAAEVAKVANDIRLMASGPVAGLSELSVPAVHAGSSIMPGKVNPSLAECMNMVCFAVHGNDAAVSMAAQAGQFELNVMLPGMLRAVMDSVDTMGRFLPVFSANLVDGLASDRAALRSKIAASPVMVTLLAPRIGYAAAAALFKESLRTGRPVGELAAERGLVTARQAAELLG